MLPYIQQIATHSMFSPLCFESRQKLTVDWIGVRGQAFTPHVAQWASVGHYSVTGSPVYLLWSTFGKSWPRTSQKNCHFSVGSTHSSSHHNFTLCWSHKFFWFVHFLFRLQHTFRNQRILLSNFFCWTCVFQPEQLCKSAHTGITLCKPMQSILNLRSQWWISQKKSLHMWCKNVHNSHELFFRFFLAQIFNYIYRHINY